MRAQDLDQDHEAVAAGRRRCAIDGCPLAAVELVSVLLADDLVAWLPTCWYHGPLVIGTGLELDGACCPQCGVHGLQPVRASATDPVLARWRCPACGREEYLQVLVDQLLVQRDALYAQQCADAVGDGPS
jgi:hypothetical protein